MSSNACSATARANTPIVTRSRQVLHQRDEPAASHLRGDELADHDAERFMLFGEDVTSHDTNVSGGPARTSLGYLR